MKILLKSCILLFFVISCNSKSADLNMTPDIETVSIPISSDQLNSYQVYSSYNERNTNKLIGYNGARHSLDYFDLDNSKVLKSENLNHDGPNGIGTIESIYWHNSDSIFMFERGKIHIVKEGGKKTNTINLYDLFTGKDLGEPICNYYFKLNYRESEKLIYFFLVQHGSSPEEKSSLPLVASVNIETLSVRALPITHSKHYKEIEGRVGFITYLGFQDFMADEMIYNFQYESTLFSLNDKSNDTLESKSHEMKFIPELLSQEDPSAFDLHAIDNPHFLTPIPDNWRNLIYRGTWDSPDKSLAEHGFTEKAMSISVFDSKMSFISKFSLPNYTYQINNWFVNENGLYLNLAHPKNEKLTEEFLVFHVFQFDQID
ncbi:MAG: DUF4221 family protein [Algoriphagus sp.]|nr:DUF4221 family protein [Algoriphagus sp.]